MEATVSLDRLNQTHGSAREKPGRRSDANPRACEKIRCSPHPAKLGRLQPTHSSPPASAARVNKALGRHAGSSRRVVTPGWAGPSKTRHRQTPSTRQTRRRTLAARYRLCSAIRAFAAPTLLLSSTVAAGASWPVHGGARMGRRAVCDEWTASRLGRGPLRTPGGRNQTVGTDGRSNHAAPAPIRPRTRSPISDSTIDRSKHPSSAAPAARHAWPRPPTPGTRQLCVRAPPVCVCVRAVRGCTPSRTRYLDCSRPGPPSASASSTSTTTSSPSLKLRWRPQRRRPPRRPLLLVVLPFLLPC